VLNGKSKRHGAKELANSFGEYHRHLVRQARQVSTGWHIWRYTPLPSSAENIVRLDNAG